MFLSPEIIVSLIALIGVLISALVSLFISKAEVNSRIKNLRYEIQQTYAANLQEKRMEVYPALYTLLSEFTNRIQNRTLSLDWLKGFYADLCEWDAKHALFLSARTNGLAYKFRRFIRNISETNSTALEQRLKTPEKRQQLIRKAWELELALKNDLGIFQVEFFNPEKIFDTYDDISETFD